MIIFIHVCWMFMKEKGGEKQVGLVNVEEVGVSGIGKRNK